MVSFNRERHDFAIAVLLSAHNVKTGTCNEEKREKDPGNNHHCAR